MPSRLIPLSFLTLVLLLAPGVHARTLELIAVIPGDTDHTMFGWHLLPLGDQNDDGYADFLTHDQRFKAYFFHGGTPPAGTPYLILDSVGNRFSSFDYNGDGYTDLFIDSWQRWGWKTNLFLLGPEADTTRDLWFGADALLPIGYNAIADFNGDGIEELVGWLWPQNSLLFYDLGPALDSLPDFRLFPPPQLYSYQFADNILCRDFNGDGRHDLIANIRSAGAYQIPGRLLVYLAGPDFDSVPDLTIARRGPYENGHHMFGLIAAAIGDVNGDSYEDFFAAAGAGWDSLGFVYFGGPALDTVPDLITTAYPSIAAAAGDINHDGYADFMLGYTSEYSSAGWAKIYCGGPDLDSLHDITLDANQLEGYRNDFAYELEALGDINGDGIDDIGVYAGDASARGYIYLYAGYDTTTVGIDDPLGPSLPTTFTLHQNYPNPFNPSTTISFSLPHAETISLRILNPLGQTVTVLLDHQRLGPGTHSVTWDASDHASGLYLAELIYPSGKLSRKMVLLK